MITIFDILFLKTSVPGNRKIMITIFDILSWIKKQHVSSFLLLWLHIKSDPSDTGALTAASLLNLCVFR